ncbi:MAG: hypothetical protein FJ241_10620 [Nitrospira sp.]|nr:hypothetical protein [Nitrospira sp.]
MTFYWLGGRNDKWLRRFIAPLFVAVYGGIASRWFIGVVLYVLLSGSYHLGYGDNSRLGKIFVPWLTRLICAIAYTAAGLLVGITSASWVLLGIHLLSIPFATLAGLQMIKVKGVPLKAPYEESIIALSTTLWIPWMM